MNLLDRPVAPAPYSLLPEVPSFTVTSDSFVEGAAIPPLFSGEGEDVSPQLTWSGFPEGTRSFLVNCFDPDAPTPAGFWHWTVANVPAEVTSLAANAGKSDRTLPQGAFHLCNDGSARRYMGPLPPEGDRAHRYYFAVHALDLDRLPLDAEATATAAAFTILGHTLARGVLVGTYQR